MGVSNGYDIGVNGRDLILKTAGKVYIKVADKFYELDFRNEKTKTDTTESSEITQSDVVLLDTLSKENYPGDNKLVINNDELYITKGGSYKKVNNSTVSNQTDTVEFDNLSSNDLFVQISDGVWSLGESASGSDIEFIQNPNIIWNDYCFFNSVFSYFFDDIYGDFDEETFWTNIFFNVTDSDSITWTAKNKSEIEKTIITNAYKDQVQVKITDFKDLYESFWYSANEFVTKISEYKGSYAEINISSWSKAFSPKSEISINGYSALITTVIGDSLIVKFKEENATLNAGNIQKADGSLIICKKNGIAFLDVTNSDSIIYNNLSQDINDIRVRIGDLSSLDGYSGLGSIFNGNVVIKNGPFNLNSDGSGNIGSELSWDKNGKLHGSLIDRIAAIEKQIG